jgi:hypothetical protein
MSIKSGKLEIIVRVITDDYCKYNVSPSVWKHVLPQLAKYDGLHTNIEPTALGECCLVNLECPPEN